MIRVGVKFYGPLRKLVSKRELAFEFKKGCRIDDVITALVNRFGSEFKLIISNYSTGTDSPYSKSFFVLINGFSLDSIRNGGNIELDDGDIISLIPHISGG